jgi:transposase
MDISKLHLHWRISQYKGNKYRSYSLARAYRSDGKNRKEIVVKLGKLSDSEAERWRNILKAIKNPSSFLTTLDNIVVAEHYAYLDVAVVSAIWDEWELDEVFQDNGKRNVEISTIARILTINRCIDPSSKSQTPQWFRSTSLPWLLDVKADLVYTSRIFRELAIIENHKEAICKHLYTRIKGADPKSLKSVFYDLSSSTFTGRRCVLMRWGHCKEGYRNHVVLALVVNSEGFPFYWEVLPGGTADAKTITWLIERLQERFKKIEMTLTFDRGMVSDDNLALIETANINYVSAMDRSQLEGITGLDFTAFSYLDPDKIDKQAVDMHEFKKLNDTTYYREIKVEGKRRYILCFNPELFKDQRKTRIQAVTDFRKFVNEMNIELKEAKKSRQKKTTYNKFKQKLVKVKLDGFVDVKLNRIYNKGKTNGRAIRTYQAAVSVDDTALGKAGRLDGFWLLVTNHIEKADNKVFKVSAQEAIAPYRDKIVIESAFRDIKSFVEIAPIYVWTENHVKAHYTICVLSHLINRTITLRLHNNKGNKTQEIVSHEKFYKILSGCQIDYIKVKNVNMSSYNMTEPVNEQKELLGRVGIMNLLDNKAVEKARVALNS